MNDLPIPPLTVVRPGEGDTAAIPGFAATFELRHADTAGALSIVEHPFAVGTITRAHKHSREDEYSIVLAGSLRWFWRSACPGCGDSRPVFCYGDRNPADFDCGMVEA